MLALRLRAFRRTAEILAARDVAGTRLFRLPRQAFAADLAAWGTAGMMMVVVYYTLYDPFATTAVKVLVGCAAFGIFSGMLSYLSCERRIIFSLRDRTAFELPGGRQMTVSRKMFILIVAMLGIMALAILMMVLLDVYYLIGQNFSQPGIYWGIFKEIAFALCVLLGISLFIVHRYARNLKNILDTQLAAMADISRGNLEKQVPILSGDEFGRVAEKTNLMMEGLKERDFCRASFDRYVSPEVSRKILDDTIAPDGELVDVTVLFCDLRNYTGFAEKHNPRDIVAMLNSYFSAMEATIRENKGVVLQFIGDEIEAVFGAPEPDPHHPDHAVSAALAMMAALEELNTGRRKQGAVEIRHGIGIHTGTVLAGNVGSEQRRTYSLLGDTVNLASRLQVLNKRLGTTILISGATRERLRRADLPVTHMGRHALRGKTESVDAYAIG